jgi:hypothetical protein
VTGGSGKERVKVKGRQKQMPYGDEVKDNVRDRREGIRSEMKSLLGVAAPRKKLERRGHVG